MVSRRLFIHTLLAAGFAQSLDRHTARAQTGSQPEGTLQVLVDSIRRQYNVPALFAAVGYGGKIVKAACSGRRKLGYDSPAQVDDLLAIGSISKSCGAIVACNLAAEDTLPLNSSISQILPELRATMNPAYRNVTLLQLLKHTGGVAKDINIPARDNLSTQQHRYKMAMALLQAPPAAQAGQFSYSSGYEIVAVMCERVTNETYEQLLAKYIFKPCGMTTARMGRAYDDGSPTGRLDQPWGHYKKDGVIVPFSLQSNTHMASSAGGGIICCISDLCRYGLALYPGLQGEKSPMGAAAFDYLRQYMNWSGGFSTNGASSGDYSTLIVRPDSAVIAIHATLMLSDGGQSANEKLAAALESRFDNG